MKKKYVFGAAFALCGAFFLFGNLEHQTKITSSSKQDIDIKLKGTQQRKNISSQQIINSESPPAGQIESCISLYTKQTVNYRKKELLFNQLNIEWTQASVPFWQRQRAAIALGFSPNEARSMLWTKIQFVHNISAFRLFTDPEKHISRRDYAFTSPEAFTGSFEVYISHMNQLLSFIENADYQGLIAYRTKHQIPYKMVLSEDLLSIVFLLQPKISVHDVSYLLTNGIDLSLKSLVLLSELDDGLAIAQEVVSTNPEFQYDIEWQNGYFYINLTLDAIQRGEFELASFWLAHQVKANINTRELNALDYFPEPNESEYSKAIVVLEQIINLGLQPNFPTTTERLKQWLKPEDRYLLEGVTMSWSVDELLANNQELSKVKQQVDEITALTTEEEMRQLTQCVNSKTIQALLPNKTLGRESNSPAPYKTTQEVLQYSKARFLKVMQMTTEERHNPKFLGSNKSLQQLREEYAENHSMTNPWQALGYKSLKQILHLLETEQQLPESAIYDLAAVGKIQYIEKLIPYGLNINYVNEHGENALFAALDTRAPLTTMHYLLDLGIPIISQDALLNKAILKSQLRSEMVNVIRLLKSRGVTPKAMHLNTFAYAISGQNVNYAELKSLLN